MRLQIYPTDGSRDITFRISQPRADVPVGSEPAGLFRLGCIRFTNGMGVSLWGVSALCEFGSLVGGQYTTW